MKPVIWKPDGNGHEDWTDMWIYLPYIAAYEHNARPEEGYVLRSAYRKKFDGSPRNCYSAVFGWGSHMLTLPLDTPEEQVREAVYAMYKLNLWPRDKEKEDKYKRRAERQLLKGDREEQ